MDLFAVADGMEARGWHMDRQQAPTAPETGMVEDFIRQDMDDLYT